MHPFINNIRVYFITNLPTVIISGLFTGCGIFFIWLLAFVWNTNTERLTDIAKATQATAASMQELVIFVKEDRVKITNLERRMLKVEERLDKKDEEAQDFWKNYYYNPKQKLK